jgi:hypothetical protein
MLRQLLLTALALLLSVAVLGCSSSTTEEPTSGESQAATQGDAQAAPLTSEDIAAAFEAEYGSEEWFSHVQWVGTDQILLAEVTRIDTDLALGDSNANEVANQISDAMMTIVGAQDVVNIAVADAEGAFITTNGWGSAFEDTYDVPRPPTSAEEIKAWIDEAFSASGEEWHAHVKSVDISDDVGGWSGTTMIVVNTDFPERSPEAQTAGTTVGQAIALSGQTVSDKYAIFTASGEHILSGGIPPASWSY